ncbi:MAG TPA: hypothetical protein VN107_06005 [Microbacterium sp.]|nr:hypothetical protein [Microbacterium sp.]
MSIFALRPEEPSESAGVPSEPERSSTPAEHLPVATTDAASLELPGVASVTIPVTPVPDADR